MAQIFTRILLVLVASFVMGAEPQITYQPFPDTYGVKVITPTSQAFAGEIQRLCNLPQMQVVERAIPYSIILKNTSTQRITAFVVRYKTVNDARLVTWHTLRYESGRTSQDARFSFGPMKSFFVSPVRAINRAITFNTLNQLPGEVLSAQMARGLALVQNQRSVTVLLDSVMFEDGSHLGPDTANDFRYFLAQFRAEMDFKRTVAALHGDELKSYLNQLKNAPQANTAVAEMSEAEHYSRSLSYLATCLLTAMNTRGEEALSLLSSLPTYKQPFKR